MSWKFVSIVAISALTASLVSTRALAETGPNPSHVAGATTSADVLGAHPAPPTKSNACKRVEGLVRGVLFQHTPMLSLDDYTRLYTLWPEDEKKAYLAATPGERGQMIFKHYGFIAERERPGPNARGIPLPMGLSLRLDDKGNAQLHANCLMCHGGTVFGQPMIGIGVNRIAFDTFVRDSWRISGRSLPQFFLSRRFSYTRGVPDAFSPAGALFHMRDRMLRARGYLSMGLERASPPLLSAASSLITPFPVSVKAPDMYSNVHSAFMKPTSWLAQTNISDRSYLDGRLEKNSKQWVQFLIDETVTPEQINGYKPQLEELNKLMQQCELPPTYRELHPEHFDEGAAKRGQVAYGKCCTQCHGDYQNGEYDYPERIVPYRVVKTDGARMDAIPASFARRLTEEVEDKKVDPEHLLPEGYRAPSLVRIALRPPYLHNGSVPTLAGILSLDERPKYWDVSTTEEYDHTKMGFNVRSFDTYPREYRGAAACRLHDLYDTTLHGHGNGGHDYACIRAMTPLQKTELIEYLKTF